MPLDPNNLNLSKINLSRRVSQPLRSIMSTGKRMMSKGKFIKSMRSSLVGDKSDGITDKVAKKMALRMAVGVKELGVTYKKERTFFRKMRDQGLLSAMYKRTPRNAIAHYKQVAGLASAANDDKQTNADSEHNQLVNQENKDQHGRMQKIRDDIEDQKKEKQDRELSENKDFGRIDSQNAVTSVDRLVHKPGVDTSAKLAAPLSSEDSMDFAGSADIHGPVQLD